MNLEDRIMEEASKGNYNKVYALALLYLCKKKKEKKKKKKERKWIILKFPWLSTCAQSAEE